MNYWKLGCDYWGEGGINFYTLLTQNSIVICGDCDMKVGDVVAIADGYTIKAIAIITDKRKSVVELPQLESLFAQYEIDYEDWITVANANIIELNKDEQFQYHLRQGIRKIQKDDIIKKIKTYLDNIDRSSLYKKLLETYKAFRRTYDFDDDEHSSYEIFKWQLITVSQGKTPIEIVKAHNANPNDSNKGGFYNLIYIEGYNKVFKYLCNSNPKELELILNNLVDENSPLNDRLYNFKNSMADLIAKLETDYKNKANDERTAAIILTCCNPQKYTFYKNSFYEKLCCYLCTPTESTGKKFSHYLNLIQPLVNLIEHDTELKTIVSNSATANLLQSNLLLAQDICYELFDAFPNLLSKQITMQNSKYQKYTNLLKATHNLILTGAPGTGKTYLAKEIAKEMGAEVEFVQFHPSYDYTDFVEGLRPIQEDNGNVGFERKDGVFKEFCALALKKSKSNAVDNFDEGTSDFSNSKPFIFIIDEINRGEISKIFGELFFSIDPDYRGEKGLVQTQYQNLIEDGDMFKNGFFVPENVYIIGTMNDIDRSVESMDFAFRRRFAFVEVKADENVGMLDGLTWKDEALRRMKNLNKAISDVDGLSSAYHIGASYFLKLNNYGGDFQQLWDYHLEGLLREYLRGNQDVDDEIKKLKAAYDNDSDFNH